MSGLDFYIHEVIRYGIIQIFNNERPKTDKYKNVLVYMECVEKALKNPERIDWLEENIVSQNERKTFMATKKIKEALEIISKKNIFKNALNKTSEELNINYKELEEKLKELYSRRNKIAHQSDRNPISKTINHIEANYVKQYISIMKSLVSNIHDEINAEV